MLLSSVAPLPPWHKSLSQRAQHFHALPITGEAWRHKLAGPQPQPQLTRGALLFLVKLAATAALMLIASWAVPSGLFMPAASAQSPQFSLLNAVEDGDIEEVQKLLREGVSPNTRRRADGSPALLIAAISGNAQVLKALIDAGANPNISDRERGETALMRRSLAGDTGSLKLLIDAGANVNQSDAGLETALIKAVRARKSRAVAMLLENGADPNVQDLTGKTALEYARLSRSSRMVRLLEDAGATL